MRVFILSCAVTLATGAASAQEAPLAKVYACASIVKADERLACYDAEVAGLRQAQVTGGVAVVSREQVAEAGEKAFGFGEPDAAGIAAPRAPDPLDNLQVIISTATRRADGKYRFTLDNGQVWDQIEADRIGRLGALPVKAAIKTAALGSFLMRIDGGRSIRVRRVK